ncbi:MAG: 4,5-DOPA dioxygenase extradiol [Chloroflexi bacterium]|nr:4,5-DOPA dioxygenase extradiol [Chloroflexota bacterium]
MPSSQPDFTESHEKLPVLFVGHGSPMNAIEDNTFSRAWAEVGKALPRPQAILCVSAHWETVGTQVTAMAQPRTIHDFGGFPPELYAQQYPAPGSPELARLVQETVGPIPVGLDASWGLDHGAWSVLLRMFPRADIPVVQLSLDRTQPPAYHYALGQALAPLRQRGVLIVGSGNMVHNLRAVCFEDEDGAYDWATEFDETMHRLIVAGDHAAIVNYDRLGKSASLSIPTNEHFLPLLYVLGALEEGETMRFFNDKITYCSLSMRSVWVG